jgi:hypothetical protein
MNKFGFSAFQTISYAAYAELFRSFHRTKKPYAFSCTSKKIVSLRQFSRKRVNCTRTHEIKSDQLFFVAAFLACTISFAFTDPVYSVGLLVLSLVLCSQIPQENYPKKSNGIVSRKKFAGNPDD